MQFALEVAISECSFLKHSTQGILRAIKGTVFIYSIMRMWILELHGCCVGFEFLYEGMFKEH
jgi:hypothetical protein